MNFNRARPILDKAKVKYPKHEALWILSLEIEIKSKNIKSA